MVERGSHVARWRRVIVLIVCFFFLAIHFFPRAFTPGRTSELGVASISHSLDNFPDNKIHGIKNKHNSLLCFIPCARSTDTRKKDVIKETWGGFCDLLLFIDEDTPGMNITWEENYHLISKKSHQVWLTVYHTYGKSYDFFMKADFDTYILGRNLREYLNNFNPREPHYIGKQLVHPQYGPFVAGASAILSQSAVASFQKATYRRVEECSEEFFEKLGSQDDLALGVCLQRIGIYPHNTRNEANEERFMIFDVEYMYDDMTSGISSQQWYKNMSFNPSFGISCCSKDAVCFHQVNIDDMFRKLDYVNGRWQWTANV